MFNLAVCQGTQIDTRRIHAFFCYSPLAVRIYTYILEVLLVNVHQLPPSKPCKSVTALQTVLTVFTFECVQPVKLICCVRMLFL